MTKAKGLALLLAIVATLATMAALSLRWYHGAGTIINKTFSLEMLNIEDPTERQKEIESCTHLTATVREVDKNTGAIQLHIPGHETLHIIAYLDNENSNFPGINDYIELQGQVNYLCTSAEPPNHLIRIGSPEPSPPFTFYAKFNYVSDITEPA